MPPIELGTLWLPRPLERSVRPRCGTRLPSLSTVGAGICDRILVGQRFVTLGTPKFQNAESEKRDQQKNRRYGSRDCSDATPNPWVVVLAIRQIPHHNSPQQERCEANDDFLFGQCSHG